MNGRSYLTRIRSNNQPAVVFAAVPLTEAIVIPFSARSTSSSKSIPTMPSAPNSIGIGDDDLDALRKRAADLLTRSAWQLDEAVADGALHAAGIVGVPHSLRKRLRRRDRW